VKAVVAYEGAHTRDRRVHSLETDGAGRELNQAVLDRKHVLDRPTLELDLVHEEHVAGLRLQIQKWKRLVVCKPC